MGTVVSQRMMLRQDIIGKKPNERPMTSETDINRWHEFGWPIFQDENGFVNTLYCNLQPKAWNELATTMI